jgi:DMSO/TMAO reductase YedYZ heme-binding membrane subunit
MGRPDTRQPFPPPEEPYPQNGYQQDGYQEGGYQQGGYQEGGYPQDGYQQDAYPQGGYQQTASFQADAYPQGYQQASFQPGAYPQDSFQQGGLQQDLYPPAEARPRPERQRPERGRPERERPESRRARTVDGWMDQPVSMYPRLKRKQVTLFLLRLPAFVPWFFIMRGWLSLNAQQVLTNTEADVLGTGGEICFFLAITITPMITLTGVRFFAPLRRWYGIFFALIGVSDATTAAITTTFAGGVFGRLAGHTFLVTGFLIVLIAIPLLVTANTPAQRKMGRYWKRLQKMTYLIWGFVVLHLLLLDDFKPFDGAQGDGDPIFHQRFYQVVAISLPLLLLRLPPIKRWVTDQREAGQRWKIYAALAPVFALYIIAFLFIINEEIFTGTQVITMHPPAN